MRYEIYRDNQNKWRWRFVADNNKIIAVSSESYYNYDDCMTGMMLMTASSSAPIINGSRKRK